MAIEIITIKTKASVDYQSVELEASMSKQDIADGGIEKIQKWAAKLAVQQSDISRKERRGM